MGYLLQPIGSFWFAFLAHCELPLEDKRNGSCVYANILWRKLRKGRRAMLDCEHWILSRLMLRPNRDVRSIEKHEPFHVQFPYTACSCFVGVRHQREVGANHLIWDNIGQITVSENADITLRIAFLYTTSQVDRNGTSPPQRHLLNTTAYYTAYLSISYISKKSVRNRVELSTFVRHSLLKKDQGPFEIRGKRTKGTGAMQ